MPTPLGTANAASDEHWEDGTTVAESAKKMLEEPTIEDQARTLPPLQLVPPVNPRSIARLTVTAGPDQGRTYELAGRTKPSLIGRAVENDVVLTDLSVSRRHLELAWDGSAWVLRDCGSGNGTLINDRLEDGRCQLRHGDRIEIGNTIFRFDHGASADGEASVDVPMGGWGQTDDDEELATVNGRPRTGESPAIESRARQNATVPPVRQRPGPTGPPQPRPGSVGPPTLPPNARARTTNNAASSVPIPRPPPPPGAPHDVGDPALLPSLPLPRFLTADRASMPPGQPGMSGPMPPMMAGGPPVGAAPPMYGPPGRAPVPGMMRGPMSPFVTVRGPDRRKQYIAIAGGAMVVAIVIGAITGGGDKPQAGSVPAAGSGSAPGSASGSGSSGATTGSQGAPTTGPQITAAGDVTMTGSGSAVVTPSTLMDGSATGTGSGAGSAVVTATGSGAGSAVVTATGSGAGSAVVTATGSGAGSAVVTATGSGAGSATPTGPGSAAGSSAGSGAGSAAVKPTGPQGAAATVTHTATKKKPVPRTTTTRVAKVTPPPPPPPDSVKGPVTGKAVAAAEKKAETLYRARKFSDAATTLRGILDELDDPATVKRLKAEATNYESLGTNIASGSSGDATVAYGALTRALATDRKIGEAHQGFIRDRLVPVAPKAAATFLARGKYEEAKRAADTAVNVGAGGTPTVQQVRSTLESKAGAMYTAAAKVFDKKPEDAKAQLRRVMAMVPSDSPWYSKASKLLKGGSRRDDDD